MRSTHVTAAALLIVITAGIADAQQPKQVQGFSVLLLLGETQGTTQPENISAPARKALADIRDFLPYKSFRVLDTVWVAGSEVGNNSGTARGLDDQAYHFILQTNSKVPGAKSGTPEATLGTARFVLQAEGLSGFPPTNVLDNRFNINAGETVVVGTSRIQGERALIVLLTAVAK
jgi:hypothetical protein